MLVLCSESDVIIAQEVCGFLDQNGFETIFASESKSEEFSIDISNENDLLETVQLLPRSLLVYSDCVSPDFRKAVEQIFAVKNLHTKSYILIFNTSATELQIPDAVNRRYTDRRMMQKRALDLLQGVGGMYMHDCLSFSLL